MAGPGNVAADQGSADEGLKMGEGEGREGEGVGGSGGRGRQTEGRVGKKPRARVCVCARFLLGVVELWPHTALWGWVGRQGVDSGEGWVYRLC